jgi:AAA domain-containing protein
MIPPILIIGKPGAGKSASLRNLDPKTTFLINVIGKSLPFKTYKRDYKALTGWNDKTGNRYASDKIENILKCIDVVNKTRHDIKTLVVDDWQYILSHEFMRRAKERSFDKYNDMASNGWYSIMALKELRADLIPIVMGHSELDATGFARLKTVGKLLSEKMDFEGEFEMCLHARVEDGEYLFQTQQDGEFMARTPMEMFDDLLIPNDLQMVINAVKSYFYDEE